ncbi:MAG TPA: hypothetical protein VFB29_01330 [Pseudolabrys sp.]|nr:hypothetical protein [Pseudolabrys sp.]
MQKLTVLAATAIIALTVLSPPAEAFRRVPGQTQSQLKAKCDAAGGTFAVEPFGGYACQTDSGWAVNCYNSDACFSWCTGNSCTGQRKKKDGSLPGLNAKTGVVTIRGTGGAAAPSRPSSGATHAPTQTAGPIAAAPADHRGTSGTPAAPRPGTTKLRPF